MNRTLSGLQFKLFLLFIKEARRISGIENQDARQIGELYLLGYTVALAHLHNLDPIELEKQFKVWLCETIDELYLDEALKK